MQTRAALDVARRAVAALTVRAPVAGTVSLSPPPPAGQGSGTASGLLGQLPESLQGQAGDLLGGSGAGAGSSSVDAVLAEGRPVTSGQPILTVTDTSTLSLTAQVDETDVLLVRAGCRPRPSWTRCPTRGTRPRWPASTRRRPRRPRRRDLPVRLTLGAGRMPRLLRTTPRPGMSAVVDLQVRTADRAVAVPAAAVFRDGVGTPCGW